MALSNILREPRREITETVMGLAVVAIPVSIVCGTALILHWTDSGDASAGLCFFAAFVLWIGLAITCGIFWGVALLAHAIGEDICDILEKRGIHLRPRIRK